MPFATCLLAAVFVQACGKRGIPLLPLIIVPGQVSVVSADRFDNRVYVTFRIPSENSDGSGPADLDRVEIYALTTEPEEDFDTQAAFDDWLDAASLIATIKVQQSEEIDPTAELTDPVLKGEIEVQGAEVTVVEHLTAETFIPVSLEEDVDDSIGEEEPSPTPKVMVPSLAPSLPHALRRTYVVRGMSRRGREGVPSDRVAVPLTDSVQALKAPTVSYGETGVQLIWTRPATARLPIQDGSTAGLLESTPILELSIPSVFDVYDVTDTGSAEEIEKPQALNGNALVEVTYTDALTSFGAERCYVVRMIDFVDGMEVRSFPSASTCITPVDVFPPAAPSGLIAIAIQGAISLVWDENSEVDVEGYIVLRGGNSDETLVPLTPEPIKETTFRDDSIEVDVTYQYAVQAIDESPNANISPESNRVVERAR